MHRDACTPRFDGHRVLDIDQVRSGVTRKVLLKLERRGPLRHRSYNCKLAETIRSGRRVRRALANGRGLPQSILPRSTVVTAATDNPFDATPNNSP